MDLSKSAKNFPNLLVEPPTPESENLDSCLGIFCYHCVESTTNDLLNKVEQNLSIYKNKHNLVKHSTSTINKPKSRQILPKLDLFAPTHRRSRSDDILGQKWNSTHFRNNFDPKLAPASSFIGQNFSSTLPSQNFSSLLPHCGFNVDETIKQSLKQAEDLKKFIAKREYETNLELEKENAHFLLSEMLLASIEQMKWRNIISTKAPPVFQNRPFRKFSNTEGVENRPQTKLPSFNEDILSTNSCENVNSYCDELDRTVGDFTDSQCGSLSDLQVHTVSDKSDEASDTGYSTSVPSSNNQIELFENSAELVAMNLLQNFSKKHFPQANNMQFLVSYKDAPQLLLPMPSSTTVAPDDMYIDGSESKVNIRGTFDWAPPRQQLIFQLQTPQKLKILLSNQGNKCPGCGRKIEPSYYKRLRYCAYLGKAFCQCCHRGETALIPAQILHKWNFRRLPVSDFSYRFLSTTCESPYYNVADINPSLYEKVKTLKSARDKRRQLIFMYDYIRTCRRAKEVVTKDGNLFSLFERLPAHHVQDLNLYSIKDFVMIVDGVYERLFENALKWAKFHIETCEYCVAKGFYCEICLNKDVLFPFQIQMVRRCELCGSCFHKKCVKKKFSCPKCRRIKSRKEIVFEKDED